MKHSTTHWQHRLLALCSAAAWLSILDGCGGGGTNPGSDAAVDLAAVETAEVAVDQGTTPPDAQGHDQASRPDESARPDGHDAGAPSDTADLMSPIDADLPPTDAALPPTDSAAPPDQILIPDIVLPQDVSVDDGRLRDVFPAVDEMVGQDQATMPDDADGVADAQTDSVGPPPVCTAGTHWSAGTPIFVERTADWGLQAIGAEGVRINVFDYDGDGWADILVRRAVGTPSDLSARATQNVWLLRNLSGAGFEDVTVSSGILNTRLAQSANVGRPGQVYAAADVDNDGDLDLYCGSDTNAPTTTLGETSEILLNDGMGGFDLAPAESEVRRATAVDTPAGASFVDYDRDGAVDLWVTQHDYTSADGSSIVLQQDRLYRGDGTGLFADETIAAGLGTEDWLSLSDLNQGRAHTRAWGAAACDLNGDGMPELMSPSYGRAPNHLWLGDWQDGQPQFANRSVASGYAYDSNFTWQDNQFARCYCASHRSAPGCADLPTAVIDCGQTNWDHSLDRERFRLGGNSAATICADLDNDGDIDLLTSEIRHWWAGTGSDPGEVLVNDGQADVHFERPGDAALGLEVPHDPYNWDEGHMTGTVFDFDNDGWSDIYIGASDYAGNRGLLYHQEAPLTFAEVATGDFFEHNRSHGVAVADFDHDGDLDIVAGHSLARCDASAPNNCYPTAQVRIFENVFGDQGNWLQLQLVGGPNTNLAAIGARVTVSAGGISQTQEVGGGYGHFGAQNDLVLHFGLGAACEAQVTVRWPDAALTTVTHTLQAGRRYAWSQGAQPQASF